MYIARLFYPGTQTVYAPGISEKVTPLARLLGRQIDRAAISLSLFETADPPVRPSSFTEDPGESLVSAARIMWDSLYAPLLRPAEGEAPESFDWRRDTAVSLLARHLQLSARWSDDRGPRAYTHAVSGIFAEAFIFALEGAQLAINQLNEVVPHDIADVLSRWIAAFPGLTPVRDAAHHIDERVQGLAYGREMPRPPIDQNGFSAEEGGRMIVTAGLVGDTYVATGKDGAPSVLPINTDTLEQARYLAQEVLGRLSWSGAPHFTPFD